MSFEIMPGIWVSDFFWGIKPSVKQIRKMQLVRDSKEPGRDLREELRKDGVILKSRECLESLESLPWTKFCVDHCHKTQVIRGLLCSRCNSGIGIMNDDVRLLKRAISYLDEHELLDKSLVSYPGSLPAEGPY